MILIWAESKNANRAHAGLSVLFTKIHISYVCCWFYLIEKQLHSKKKVAVNYNDDLMSDATKKNLS